MLEGGRGQPLEFAEDAGEVERVGVADAGGGSGDGQAGHGAQELLRRFAPAHAVEGDVPLANLLAFIGRVQGQPR